MLASACFGMFGASAYAAQCPASAPSASRVVASQINATRAAQGVPALRPSPVATRPARSHSIAMASAGRLWHDLGSWARGRAGQNVGGGSSALQVFNAMMASPPHRQAILDRSFRGVGVSAARRCGGGLMVTVNFTG